MELKAQNISMKYRKNGRNVLEDVSLSVKDGDYTALMGESGSGKSTLLAIMAGILRPTEGEVHFDDKNLYRLKDAELSEVHKEGIAFVPQSNIFIKNHTILENIITPHIIQKGADETLLREKAEEYLERFGIADLANRYPYELSGGEQKRASLVRTLVTDPKVLIADEPTTGLDKKTGALIMDSLKEYADSGKAVLIATHDELIKGYEIKAFYIEKGKITAAE